MALSCDVHQNNIQRPSKQNVLTGVIFCMILCLLTHWPENFNPKSWAKLTSPEFPSPFLFCRMRSVFSCSRWLKNFSRPHWAERSSFKICGSRLTAETRQEWYDTNIVEPPPRWTEHLCRWPSSRRAVFFQRTRWLQRDLSFFSLMHFGSSCLDQSQEPWSNSARSCDSTTQCGLHLVAPYARHSQTTSNTSLCLQRGSDQDWTTA